MHIRLEVFAHMLHITPGELLHLARSGSLLDGLALPPFHRSRGVNVVFEMGEAVAFVAVRDAQNQNVARAEARFSLKAFADLAGIPPLQMYIAVTHWQRFRGIPLPVQSPPGSLMFEPVAVYRFVAALHRAESD